MNDKLREALEQIYQLALMKQNTLVLRMLYELMQSITSTQTPASKPEPVGMNGLTYAEESATASVMGLTRKQEPQAQAEEPEVAWVVRHYERDGKSNHYGAGMIRETEIEPWEKIEALPDGTELITLQSHREAMERLQAERDLCEQQADYWQGEAANFSVAIAKKDASLKACVDTKEKVKAAYYDAMDKYGTSNVLTTDLREVLAAITQAEEAMT